MRPEPLWIPRNQEGPCSHSKSLVEDAEGAFGVQGLNIFRGIEQMKSSNVLPRPIRANRGGGGTSVEGDTM